MSNVLFECGTNTSLLFNEVKLARRADLVIESQT